MSVTYLQDYIPSALAATETFPPNGVGPFVVTRRDLVDDVVSLANPHRSVHVSGCRGAGKTTVLRHIAEHLLANQKTVFYLKSTGSILVDLQLSKALNELMKSKVPAYVILDETQDALQTNETLIGLLKNEDNHQVTVIGAGISNLSSVSNRFGYTFPTDRMFLSEEELQTKGCYGHFCRGVEVGKEAHIKELVNLINEYAGGHIYPVMRLSELLVPFIKQHNKTGKEAFEALFSDTFRQSMDFSDVVNRILPPPPTDMRPLLFANKNPMLMEMLVKKGFCDFEGKILSHLLFDLFTGSMAAAGPRYGEKLIHGVEGVRQVLCFALPKLQWEQYDAHGGAVEDALTFELTLLLHRVNHLKTKLFNPKLIDARTAGRRPDLYLNSTVDAYVECVRTNSHTSSDIKSLEEHINRFVGNPRRYDIGERDFAILHYQAEGTVPLVPTDPSLSDVFAQRVFTFTMVNKAVFSGSDFMTTT